MNKETAEGLIKGIAGQGWEGRSLAEIAYGASCAIGPSSSWEHLQESTRQRFMLFTDRIVELAAEALGDQRARGEAIRELMGYVQDGSSTCVTLSQDDATNDYLVRVGEMQYFDKCFHTAIDKAVAATLLGIEGLESGNGLG